VSGFQASRPDGETVTLGRGGSDVTAVTLAAALDAPCDIVTDVAGVYDRDPRLHPEAELLPALDHSELVRLVERGARVVHPVAARVAEERRVPLRVYHYKASPRCTGGTLVGVAACGDRSIGASGDGARAASDASGGSDASVVAAEAPAREARAAVGGGS
ncbi:MAG TPA: hypothetical protein VK966_07000, partial [Longimicrobiales bacterium]|nr:hypothetical protein [Longimicrobiales bacterium]